MNNKRTIIASIEGDSKDNQSTPPEEDKLQEGTTQIELVAQKTGSQMEVEPPETKGEQLNIEDIIKPGKFGVTNSQMIPAIKQAIAGGSLDKLKLLRLNYLYSFENSRRYLKKAEREFIQSNL